MFIVSEIRDRRLIWKEEWVLCSDVWLGFFLRFLWDMVLYPQPMLIFLLFMAYKSNVITGVNLVATVIYQGPVSDAGYLPIWISRVSGGLLFSVVSVPTPSPEGYKWLPTGAAKLI